MRFILSTVVVVLMLADAGSQPLGAQLPREPLEIARGVPQFFIDDWLVDNRFAIKYKNKAVVHVAYPPKKRASNPLPFDPPHEGDCGYVNVARHPETGKFQLWTQVHDWIEKPSGRRSLYAIAYAESDDGLNWHAPQLGLHEWKGTTQNNIVIRGPKNARASGPQLLLTLPQEQRRGYTYIMAYRTGGAGKDNDGIRLIGSDDGVHWKTESEFRLKHLHSDTLNSIVYDADRDPMEGFDHADCNPFPGDSVRHKVTWRGGRSMAQWKGQAIRLEVFLQNADLFTLVAE